MKVLFNPIYEKAIPTNDSDLVYWSLGLKEQKIKKQYKNALDFKYLPKEISVETEEQKINKVKESLKKRNGIESQTNSQGEKDIILPTKLDPEQNQSTKITLSSSQNTKDPENAAQKKKPIFQVLEEKTDYSSMVQSSKKEGSQRTLKILLEDYDSISKLSLDISRSNIIIKDQSL